MINKISTIRTVARNLTSHLFMEGKAKITKPSVLIPGAIAAAGTAITLLTKDNSANLVVQEGDTEIQRATFEYNETPDGYELVSARSSYFYDDKENKEIEQNHYLVGPEQEKIYEYSVNYAEAPVKETTREYVDKINASVAQASGYKSVKTDYDPQESHTYGKKSLQRDIPALLKLLDIIAPNAEFTLQMKDKLKKDNQTSLVAFRVNEKGDGKEIVKGFMSTSGDTVSYHIDTEDMTIIGEQSPDKNQSKTYLKPDRHVKVKPADIQEIAKTKLIQEPKKEVPAEPEIAEVPVTAKSKPGTKPKYNDEELKERIQSFLNEGKTQAQIAENLGFSKGYISMLVKKFDIVQAGKTTTAIKKETKPAVKPEKTVEGKKEVTKTVSPKENKVITKFVPQKEQTPLVTVKKSGHVYPKEYYTDLILDAITDKKLITREKRIENYRKIIAIAYLDGYDLHELKEILPGVEDKGFSDESKKDHIKGGIELVRKGVVKEIPAMTLDYKIKELKIYKIDIDDEALANCIKNMINEIIKMKDVTVKEALVDKALSVLKDSSSKGFQSKLIAFAQETCTVNDNFKLHYEIYEEAIYDAKAETLKSQIEQMINNISDADNHEKRDEFLTKLYTTKELKELEQLQKEVQILLNGQLSQQITEKLTSEEQPIQLYVESLSSKNQDLVKKLLKCKSAQKVSLSFNEAKNLLSDIGFKETSVRGSHHTFEAPMEIIIKGRKQSIITIVSNGSKKDLEPAGIGDIISICKQYYGN